MMISIPSSQGAVAVNAATVPAISVVVPCYNGGRFLDALMASLAHQTFRNFETIIVDDGSTDELTLHKLAALEGQVQIVRQKNRGLPAARNAGIQHASAELVFPLDCDDTIEPTFLCETVAALQAAPAEVGMVVTYIRYVEADSGVIPRYFNRFDLLFTNSPSNALVFRKACWHAVGGYDETMRQGYEDWDFNLRLAEAGFRGVNIAKPLYNYRVASSEVPSMLSGIRAKRLYAKLWRDLRERHPKSYSLPTMLRLWWEARNDYGNFPLWKGLAGYVFALTLPDAVFNHLCMRVQRRRPEPATQTT
jgi:glycosyltransferase involved in cell wall biosynthesis